MNKTLITISGPTGVGKTKLSIDLAMILNCEIISSDSRQFYKELSIGTAVPSKEELNKVKHHCIQHKSILESYTIKNFEKEALNIITNQFRINKYVIMVGGSSLYMEAVIYGLDEFPEIDNKVRENLNEKYKKFGIKYLQKSLKKLDSKYYSQVDKKNPRRLIRALEVCISSKKPYSSYLKQKKRNHLFNIFHIGIKKDRFELYNTINNRVDEMLKNGLLNEVKSLIKFKDLNVLNTIGYRELFYYLENKITIEKSVEEIKKNSRRYAKRQMTWLNSKENIFWVNDKTNIEKIKNLL